MKNLLILSLAFVCSLSAAIAGAAAEPTTDPTDVQDVYLLHPGRPIMLRLHIRLAGQGYQGSWGDYLWDQFQELDADADGVLDNDEFARGDWSTLALRRNPDGAMRNELASFLDIDTDPQDGVISFTEVVKHIAQSCFSLTRGFNRNQQGLGDPLFALLDGDQDKQLNAAEISKGLASLYRYDRDEDEVYSQFELRSDGNPIFNNGPQQNGGPNAEIPFAPVPGDSLGPLATVMVRRYDRPAAGEKGGDRMLARSELRIPEEQFAIADSDGDGQIDAAELQVWLETRTPDLELIVDLDGDMQKNDRLQTIGALEDKQLELTREKEGALVLRGKSFELELRASGAIDTAQREKSSTDLFKRVDNDNNDYLDRQELRRIQRTVDFSFIDKDRDGKVFLPEYLEFVKKQADLANHRVDSALTDRGSTLFEILDTNRDNLLAPREVRALTGMLEGWDVDHDGNIKSDDVPRRYQITLAPGGSANNNQNGVFLAFEAGGGPAMTVKPDGGPEWFQRMDRNHDGDLSRREFLGSRSAFEKLDADHDGLIDRKEAEALNKPAEASKAATAENKQSEAKPAEATGAPQQAP